MITSLTLEAPQNGQQGKSAIPTPPSKGCSSTNARAERSSSLAAEGASVTQAIDHRNGTESFEMPNVAERVQPVVPGRPSPTTGHYRLIPFAINTADSGFRSSHSSFGDMHLGTQGLCRSPVHP